ncbi:MAG: insecticidal toxin complex protein [Lewinellaceae bacterium]|nr:insecticidal toxin complex protein [Lewinellaceae bacterium]
MEQNTTSQLLKTDGGKTKSNAIEIPAITLPKGGGAIKGIDEKFQVNPANGASSFSIPLPLSPNRNGFTPQLSLSYNSGAGNGLFGIGWDIDLPAIQRRTDKGLPRYFDSNDIEAIAAEDSFMFSGVEELAPYLDLKEGQWEARQEKVGALTIRQYRPRIEGGFSRIERIFHPDKGYYWRVTSNGNVTTFFGYSEACRIADPADSSKVFQWLPEFSFDDKGSWVLYAYQPEDLANVENRVHEKNRFNGNAPFVNKHLKRIKYGNQTAYYIDEAKPYEAQLPANAACFFELVLDYGEHDALNPQPNDSGAWLARKDPYSSNRACFEMRTFRLCQRVLMYHTFPELNGGLPTLVRSLDFDYSLSNQQQAESDRPTELTYLTGITAKGYVLGTNGYVSKALPTMTFDYQWLHWNTEAKNVSAEHLTHAPTGLAGNYQWVDLYNEGINGILSEQANGWFYKSNLGGDDQGDVRFSPAQPVLPKPSFTGLSNGLLQLQDLEANGEKQLVVTTPGLQGYFELTDEGEWQPFKAFLKTLNLDLRDPNVRMLDVNGDGKPEIVLSDLGAFWFWENAGKIGYDAPELATKPFDEELGASILFSDQEQRIFLADMSGDGLTDIVRIRNGEVCYWSNLGYGRFAAKVAMDNAPVFDRPELFHPGYLQLADISGTGATDIIYLGKNKFKAYLNFSGNAWSDATEIAPFFPTEQPNQVTVTDLLGNGTACIVWSSEMPAYRAAPMRYIDLMGGKKPHIMRSHENGMGLKTEVEYLSSTHYYLQDKLAGRPWITKLPFPVQVVSKTVVTEAVTNVRFTSAYSYHHGYYDHPEREFRGFGRVEQLDTEYFDVFAPTGASNTVPVEHHQPPVLTKTWFHTGAFLDKERILTHFKKEYWQEEFRKNGFTADAVEYELPDAVLLAADNLAGFDINALSAGEWREALRACKGMALRQEVFGLDADKRIADEQRAKGYADSDPAFLQFQAEARQTEQLPYSVATHNCEIQLLQARDNNRYGVFIVKESEAITYAYERDPEDPRIAHSLTIETDELGNVLEAVSVVYPRLQEEPILQETPTDSPAARQAKAAARNGQKKQWVTFTKNEVTNDIISPESYYLRNGWQSKTYELTGLTPLGAIFTIADFKGKIQDFPEIEYQQVATTGPQKRLIEHVKTKFYDAELTAPLPDGQQAIRAIPFEAYQLAYTPNLLADIFTPSPFAAQFEVTDADMQAGRFLKDDNNWWIQSGTVHHRRPGENFDAIKNRFFAPVAYTDPFDSMTEVFYDPLHLFMQRSVDMLGNESQVLRFNYRTLSPDIMRDMNDNISSVIVDELGMVKAAAVEGKAGSNPLQGEEGDNLNGFSEITDGAEAQLISEFFNLANTPAPQVCDYTALQQIARDLLGSASARMVYDFSQQPSVVASIAREQHHRQNPSDSPLQIGFAYSDGLGKVAMQKVQAEAGIVKAPDGTEIDTGNQLRWVGNGRTVLNNKGNPIKQYEPYFSITPAYETDPAWVEQGVSPVIYYDGAGRNVKTELPNGTFTKVEFDAWKQYSYDANDTVKDSDWYRQRNALSPQQPEKKAAQKTEIDHDTPSCIVTDTLGRPTFGRDHNRFADAQGNIQEEFFYTTSELDIEGNNLNVADARGNVVMAWQYDMLGHPVAQTSMDMGKRWMLNNALGNPVKTWDERGHEFSFEYDVLHRPARAFVTQPGGIPQLIELTEYGEIQADPKANNLRGKPVRYLDGSGQMTSVAFDFKGNLLEVQKQMPQDAQLETVDWNHALLDPTIYSQITEYDALNRMARLYNWFHDSQNVAVYLPVYSPRGVLQSEDLVVKAQKTDNGFTGGTRQTVVRDITYDAKGQRQRMRYGNGATTCYHYEEDTFRLLQLRTTRQATDACTPFAPSNLSDPNVLQNLFYTYDPAGNITDIHDDAYKPVFFNGQKVLPQNTYTYDALYRLISATGREHHHLPTPEQRDFDWQPTNFPMADTNLRGYTEQYQYDPVGNIITMQHIANGGSWTRNYQYALDSNRLLATEKGSSLTYSLYVNTPTLADRYSYTDQNGNGRHGSISKIGNTADNLITWDYREMIQQYNLLGGGDAFYQYSNGKERSRKYILKSGGIEEERLYLGGMERYRRWRNGNLEEEIETLHVFAGEQRILIIEDVQTTNNTQLATGLLFRYQYSNHLGSAALELNDTAAIISYEEYHPYGTTAYQAKNASIKAVAKRYRYTGMERDEESGLAYHSARYYLPWLGRWLSGDPIGVEGGGNLYGYCGGNPIMFHDSTGSEPNVVIAPPGTLNKDSTLRQIQIVALEHGHSRYEDPDNRRKFIDNGEGMGGGTWVGGKLTPVEDQDEAKNERLRLQAEEWAAEYIGNEEDNLRITEYGKSDIPSTSNISSTIPKFISYALKIPGYVESLGKWGTRLFNSPTTHSLGNKLGLVRNWLVDKMFKYPSGRYLFYHTYNRGILANTSRLSSSIALLDIVLRATGAPKGLTDITGVLSQVNAPSGIFSGYYAIGSYIEAVGNNGWTEGNKIMQNRNLSGSNTNIVQGYSLVANALFNWGSTKKMMTSDEAHRGDYGPLVKWGTSIGRRLRDGKGTISWTEWKSNQYFE